MINVGSLIIQLVLLCCDYLAVTFDGGRVMQYVTNSLHCVQTCNRTHLFTCDVSPCLALLKKKPPSVAAQVALNDIDRSLLLAPFYFSFLLGEFLFLFSLSLSYLVFFSFYKTPCGFFFFFFFVFNH